MPIALHCKECDSNFHVKDDVAGKSIRCPKCKDAVIRVPKLVPRNKDSSQHDPLTSSSDQSSSVPKSETSLQSPAQSAASQWQFKGLDGQVYGPLAKEELDRWVAEGRVNEQTQILAPGQNQWQWANTFYPSLTPTTSNYQASSYPSSHGAGTIQQPSYQNPYGGAAQYAAQTNYQRPAYQQTNYSSQQTSHRSKVAAGILGLVLGGFGVHRFYLGFVGLGVLQLVLCFVTCGLTGIWGFIEGILILTGSIDRDAEGRLLRD